MIDRMLSLVNRAQELLKDVERRLLNRKYPVGKVASEVDLQFVKSYHAEINEFLNQRQSKLRS